MVKELTDRIGQVYIHLLLGQMEKLLLQFLTYNMPLDCQQWD